MTLNTYEKDETPYDMETDQTAKCPKCGNEIEGHRNPFSGEMNFICKKHGDFKPDEVEKK